MITFKQAPAVVLTLTGLLVLLAFVFAVITGAICALGYGGTYLAGMYWHFDGASVFLQHYVVYVVVGSVGTVVLWWCAVKYEWHKAWEREDPLPEDYSLGDCW